MKYLTNKRFIGVHTLSTIYSCLCLWPSERLIFFLPACFSALCCSNESADHKWGSVSQERTLTPRKGGCPDQALANLGDAALVVGVWF